MSVHESVLDFIVKERVLSITVVCSIVTFQFISELKTGLVDPMFEFVLPEHVFDFLNVTIREGLEPPKPSQKKIAIDFGKLVKGLFTWIMAIGLIFVFYKYTRVYSTWWTPRVAYTKPE